jgi:hypothetical protein
LTLTRKDTPMESIFFIGVAAACVGIIVHLYREQVSRW